MIRTSDVAASARADTQAEAAAGPRTDHTRADQTRAHQTGADQTRADRVRIRPVTGDDEAEFIRLARQSLDLHRPWIHAPTTSAQFRAYLSRCTAGLAQGFLVELAETGAVAGFINLNEIVLGPYRRGLLGYGAFQPHAGHGYLAAGLCQVIDYSFGELELHRLEADIQPGNDRSRNLVQRAGFRLEGCSAGFILLDGEWRDHERWALTSDMPRPPVRARSGF